MTSSSRRPEVKASELRSGDLIRLSEVARVTRVSHFDGTLNVFVKFEGDVDEYRLAYKRGTKIELLHRPKAKPAVGDELSGDEVRATQWKRGATLLNQNGDQFVLLGSGRWYSIHDDRDMSFGLFMPARKYRVIHLGQ